MISRIIQEDPGASFDVVCHPIGIPDRCENDRETQSLVLLSGGLCIALSRSELEFAGLTDDRVGPINGAQVIPSF
jgi:hypothetical protein